MIHRRTNPKQQIPVKLTVLSFDAGQVAGYAVGAAGHQSAASARNSPIL